jgi:hypothetical protein
MDGCACLLQTAISEITEFRNSGSGMSPASRPEAVSQARLFHRAIVRAARLLENAALYHANWIRCLGVLSAGYTPQGHPAAVERQAHLLARG